MTRVLARLWLLLMVSLSGCDTPETYVVLQNQYPSSVVYRGFWQAVSFADPIAPGESSDHKSTVAASDNTAYVVLAPGWDATSMTPPTSFVVLQSIHGFSVHLDDTLHIPVTDATFAGSCAAGSMLSQQQADFITRRVFADLFVGLTYDAATCTTSAP